MKWILGLLITVFASPALAFSYTKEFTEADLQTKIEALMPLEKKKLFLKTTISNPKLDLHPSTNLLSIGVDIEASVPGGIKGSGFAKIEGSISYNSELGTFHLDNPTIVDLQINRVPEKYQSTIKQVVQLAISNALTKFPVYKFKDDDLKHKLAKSVLESLEVKNEKLLIKLSVL